MARYFGGFRDRLLKKGRSSPFSDRDVDWVKVSGTAIWSPEKRDYTWLDPGNYLTSFLKEGEGLFQDPAPADEVLPVKKKDKPIWDLGALANEPDGEDSYTPPSGLFSSGGIATPQPDNDAELPSIDEYKNELLSALRRRGLRVDVRKISLPEDVEQDLIRFHGGDKSIDSHALRARLQVFKRQVIESFDKFSRVGETYIIPHAPRYPGFKPEETLESAKELPETIEREDSLPWHEDGPIDFASAADTSAPALDSNVLLSNPTELDGMDSDYESFVLKSLDKLEASMGEGSDRTLAESRPERPDATLSADDAGEAERPAGARRIYDPLNGTLDIPRKSSETGPRLRPAPSVDAPMDAPGPPRFSATSYDAAMPRESWIVSPVQSRKANELDRSAASPSEDPSRAPAGQDKPHELARPKKPDVLKAFHTLRTPPAEPPTSRQATPLSSQEGGQIADARQQALSILARLDPPTGDGHAIPTNLATTDQAPNPRPNFPALESIAAAIEGERRPPDTAGPPSSRAQSLSDFLLSLKNEHEEHHVASAKASQGATPEPPQPNQEDERPPVVAKSTTHTEETQFPRPTEEKKRSVALFSKPERRVVPRVETVRIVEPEPRLNAEASHVEEQKADLPPAQANPGKPVSTSVGPMQEPGTEFPAIEAPVVEETMAETSVIEAPVVEETIAEASVIEAPVVVETIAEASVIEAPVVEETIAEASVIEAPVVEEAVVEAPVVEEAVVEAAVIEEPVLEKSVMMSSSSEEPGVEAVVVHQPDVESPIAPEPVIDSPLVGSNAVQKAVGDHPGEEDPASDALLDTSPLRSVSAAFLAAEDEEVRHAEANPGQPAPFEMRVSEVSLSNREASTSEGAATVPTPDVQTPQRQQRRGMEDGSKATDEGGDAETPAPAHVFSEQPAPVSTLEARLLEARPAERDRSETPGPTTHHFMAEHMAIPEDTDQRHAEKLTRSAREALEALEYRESEDERQPPVSQPKAYPVPPSESPVHGGIVSEAPVISEYEAKLDGVVEALAFAADDPIPLARVSRVFSEISGERRPTDAQVAESVERLNTLYSRLNRAFRVKIWAGGIRMATDPGYAEYIRAIYKQDRPKKLSRTLMETLAIVAYSQPTTRPEVDFIRGVDSDYAVRKLLEMGLVDIVGRSEAIGKPLLYGTSERFLEQFGLSELAALPKLKEIEELLDDPSLQRERMHLMALENGLDGVRGEAATSEGEEE
ncbi:MAG: SMC-Scp complex subunit ScpB [Rhodothermales bacterium]|nr:SMC-Scp complex subunit ScpB [Rhodothermales bacterium]